jgi:hypothetical protein
VVDVTPWRTTKVTKHPNAHRMLRPLHSFTYNVTTTRPNEMLLSANIQLDLCARISGKGVAI